MPNDRAINFSAGPATLPVPVLQQVQAELVCLPGVGVSPLEISHRSPWFEGVIAEAEANLRDLLEVPDTHHVVFCQGGATMQFSMVAMNLRRGDGRTPDYVLTGSWGGKAAREADKAGAVRTAWSGATDGFVRVPEPTETERYALLYAGAQKNAGPAGVTVAIGRDDVLERIPDGLPTMLDYRTYVEHGSMLNTPTVFAIYVLMLVTRWFRDEVGGLEKQAEANREKAGLVYAEIDASDGFYRGHAESGSRSTMNVTWTLPTEGLDRRFVAEAAAEGLVELTGIASSGGVRASLYNATSIEGVSSLADFMRSFARTND